MVHVSLPQCDLPFVIKALGSKSYMPLEHTSLRMLSIKSERVMLLAVTSAKRVGELNALSVNPCSLLFRGDSSSAIL